MQWSHFRVLYQHDRLDDKEFLTNRAVFPLLLGAAVAGDGEAATDFFSSAVPVPAAGAGTSDWLEVPIIFNRRSKSSTLDSCGAGVANAGAGAELVSSCSDESLGLDIIMVANILLL